jgi:hypothetical protein
MTHETSDGHDAWGNLGPAEAIPDAPLGDVEVDPTALVVPGPVVSDPLTVDDLPAGTTVVSGDEDVWEHAHDWRGGA